MVTHSKPGKIQGQFLGKFLFIRNYMKITILIFLFLTFGGKEDEKFNYEDQGIKILPIYTKIKVKNSKFLNYLNSFFIPFYIKKEIKDIDIVKQINS